MTEENKDTTEEQTSQETEVKEEQIENPENQAEEVIVEEVEEIEETQSENTEAEEHMAKAQAEVQEFKEKYMRLYADFENMRKRNAKEKLDLLKNANEDLLKDLLPVIDDFERAQKSMEDATDIEALKEGVKLIYEKFIRILGQKGLKAMESSIGNPFDLEQHESITSIPVPNEEMKGKVVDEVEKGYFLNEKVIRFAKVVIGS